MNMKRVIIVKLLGNSWRDNVYLQLKFRKCETTLSGGRKADRQVPFPGSGAEVRGRSRSGCLSP